MTRPSKTPEYRRKMHALRDRDPKSRSWFVVARVNLPELEQIERRAFKAKVPFATWVRNTLLGDRPNAMTQGAYTKRERKTGRFAPKFKVGR